MHGYYEVTEPHIENGIMSFKSRLAGKDIFIIAKRDSIRKNIKDVTAISIYDYHIRVKTNNDYEEQLLKIKDPVMLTFIDDNSVIVYNMQNFKEGCIRYKSYDDFLKIYNTSHDYEKDRYEEAKKIVASYESVNK